MQNGIFIPFLSAGIWLVASAFIILLLLVIFGYHLYQRSRVRALTGDSTNVAELAARKELLQADVASLRQWIEGQKGELSLLEGERHQQELVRGELSLIEQDLAAKRQEAQDLTAKAGDVDYQLELKRKTFEQLEAEIGNLEGMKAEAVELKAQLLKLHHELEKSKDQLGRTAELEAKHTAFATQAHLLEQEIDAHKQTLQPLRDEKVKMQEWLAKARQAAATERETRITLQQEINELSMRKEVLSIELDKLRGGFGEAAAGTDQESPYDDLLQVEPACLTREEFASPVKEQDESSFLRQFRSSLQHDGYFFSERIIDAFHTSLKCHDINPITVLAGVSGTGKTLLPIRYADFMGMHRLVMSVQPRWDSPQDMFGFYNYLEKKYKASELSRALVRMDPYNYQNDFKNNQWMHERMLLVLLDEMNLARTEYYFSEFLSKLELRRMVETQANQIKRSQAELELDAGPGSRRFRVWVPDNIFFVGTMNEDETTQTLSDKVLDRSNVIRFGKPDEKAVHNRIYDKPAKRDSFLPYKTWKSWIQTPSEDIWQNDVNRWIIEINEALDGVGRPFGFRVRQAMSTYVANYPRTSDDGRYKLAFADQIEQKILPKLRGLDMGEPTCIATLNKVASLIRVLGDSPLEEAFRKAQQESTSLGMFLWRGVTRPVDEDS
jgi:hypothetical protein